MKDIFDLSRMDLPKQIVKQKQNNPRHAQTCTQTGTGPNLMGRWPDAEEKPSAPPSTYTHTNWRGPQPDGTLARRRRKTKRTAEHMHTHKLAQAPT